MNYNLSFWHSEPVNKLGSETNNTNNWNLRSDLELKANLIKVHNIITRDYIQVLPYVESTYIIMYF